MAANMWKNSLKNVESDNNKILYETLIDFLQRNGTYCLNKTRNLPHPAAQLIFFGLLESETLGTTIFQNPRNYLCKETASHLRRLEFSAVPL